MCLNEASLRKNAEIIPKRELSPPCAWVEWFLPAHWTMSWGRLVWVSRSGWVAGRVPANDAVTLICATHKSTRNMSGPEMSEDRLRLRPRHHSRQCRNIRLLHRLQAAEVLKQSAGG